jgi:hypothetical protein
MKHERSASVQRCIGQVRSLCYLLDESTTTLTIQAGGQTITAYASGQVALDLRALPRGTTICVTLHDTSPTCPKIIAFSVIADDEKQNPNTRREDG